MDEKEAKKIHDMDQATKMLVDTLPPMLYGFYARCVEEGFSDGQAMQIVLKYLENFRPHQNE
tara:strand:- start:860 stop:1045 length:186 start_codon:yes stop_codon:yes gene_type:complete